MHSSDPMGPTPGRILLNGNAETLERFARLAARTLGDSQHRDPRIRQQGTVLICTGAWGSGERNDGALRRSLADAGLGGALPNLELYSTLQAFLAQRPVVAALYEEHTTVWWALFEAYSEENSATVARMRDAWGRALERAPNTDFLELLRLGERQAPGPRTRPTSAFLEAARARQIQRAITTLQEADARHAEALQDLWAHFHLAAGLEFDPLWRSLRQQLIEAILTASAIVIPGGSPSKLLLGLRFFQLGGALSEALRRGTSFFGTSAGAMFLGRRLVIFNDRAEPRQEFQLLENGLGLIEGLQIFPHCTDRVQTEDRANLAYLAARFRQRLCVGLNQGSVLRLEPTAGRWSAHSVGEEDVVVFDPDGIKRRAAPGEAVPLLQGAPIP